MRVNIANTKAMKYLLRLAIVAVYFTWLDSKFEKEDDDPLHLNAMASPTQPLEGE